MTAIVSAGFFLSLVSNAFAEAANPAKAIQAAHTSKGSAAGTGEELTARTTGELTVGTIANEALEETDDSSAADNETDRGCL